MYAKVFSQMYDGSLCTQGPWEALVTFQQFLVLADQEGVVDMTASAIARRTTIPLEIIERGIACLLLPDKQSRTPAEDGRRLLPLSAGRDWGWVVVNYVHYRQLKREADRREYHRDYWHKRKTQHDNTPTQQTQHTQPAQPIAEAEAKEDTQTLKAKTARKRAAPSALVSLHDLVAEGVGHQHAADWLAARKAKRLPLTPTAWDDTKLEAIKAGLSPHDAIKRAAANGWAGFKASWPDPGDARPGQLGGSSAYERKAADAAKWIKGTSLDRSIIFDQEVFNADAPQIR